MRMTVSMKMSKLRIALLMLLFGLVAFTAMPAAAVCLDPPGDITANGAADVSDTQCVIVLSLWVLSGSPGAQPACVQGELSTADINCDESVGVGDAVLSIQIALTNVLNTPLSVDIDADGDGCPDTCGSAAFCGDGTQQEGEECDDGNPTPGDGCELDCTLTPTDQCGNGVVEGDEECDDGLANSDVQPDACSSTCLLPYCGNGVIDSGEECDGQASCLSNCTLAATSVQPGDLIITEIMVAPAGVGEDWEGEWIEIYNTTDTAIDLEDMALFDDDEDYAAIFPIEPLFIGPGEYFVLGSNGDESTNGGVTLDYEYYGIFFDNDADEVEIYFDVMIDRVEYDIANDYPVTEGYSLSLSPDSLDAMANDYEFNWCVGTTDLYWTGMGSPGASNPDCPVCGDGTIEGIEECDNGVANSDVVPNACRADCLLPACGDGVVDSGESCDSVPGCTIECAWISLNPGDLVITEIMVDPVVSADSLGEWFEVRNTTGAAIDLNFITLHDGGLESHLIDAGEPFSIASGGQVVFGINGDETTNGLTPVDYVYDGISFDDFGDAIVIEVNGVIVDEVIYGPGFPLSAGKSMSLSLSAMTESANDDPDSWCFGTQVYGLGDQGSPGVINSPCSQCGNGVFELGEECDLGPGNSDTEPDTCRTDCLLPYCGDEVIDSGEDCDGGPACTATCVLLVAVEPGELIVTEVMVDPASVSDSKGEWIEIYNTSGEVLNINGVALSDDGIDFHYIDTAASIPLEPGVFFVLANNGNSATNGGVTPDYVYDGGEFALDNDEDEVILWLGTEIDRFEYDDSSYILEPGQSLGLDPDYMDDVSNDEAEGWCPGTAVFGSGDLGTPGDENPACAICGNEILETGEECDDGNIDSGDGCEPDCTFTSTNLCGNGVINPGEECDDGLANSDGLPNACRTNCLLAYCGDGVVDDLEVCDGTPGCTGVCQLAGAILPGELLITEIMTSPQAVNSSVGQWFEVVNMSAVTLDLNGLVLSDDTGDQHQVSAGGALSLAPGAYFVFGASTNASNNGGAPVDYAYSNFSLSPSSDEIVLVSFGEEVDRVNYSPEMEFWGMAGASLSLDPFGYDVEANDYGSLWCSGFTPFGDGDQGTPGAENPICPLCGDFIQSGNEECDDGNFWGGDGCTETCTLEGETPTSFTLVITEIMKEPTVVGDSDGEWIEIYNPTATDYNLAGCEIRDNGSDLHEITAPVFLPADSYVVLGVNGDSFSNGNVWVDYQYDNFTLDDDTDSIILDCDGAVDKVDYDSEFPSFPGYSMNLSLEAISSVLNDFGSSWCVSDGAVGGASAGTPGSENISCP